MNLTALGQDAVLMILAGGAASWLTADRIGHIIRGNRFDEDRDAHADDEFPGTRRSLHFIRQDIAGVMVAVIFGNGLLAAIAVALLLLIVR